MSMHSALQRRKAQTFSFD